MNISLMWLLDGIAGIPASSVSISDLTLDSREARAGGLFLALQGGKTHGLKFAADAVARGVSAVLWEPGQNVEPPKLPAPVFTAAVPGLHKLVGRIADRFFSWPSSHLSIVGITGTNGKTTCAYLLAQCLERLGIEAAYAGTLGWGRIAALERPTHTTPDAVTVHRELAQLKSMGVRSVAMEVSSHALDQNRIAGVRLHSAAFTNLSRDHLDYHASMQAYGEAKLRLFAIEGLQHVVINIGDEFGRSFAQSYAGRAPLTAVWIGTAESAWLAERTVYARGVRVDIHGISLQIEGSFGALDLHTKLLGRFNAENIVVVLACLTALGVPLQDAANALSQCSAAPGRMEVIETSARSKPLAVIDYAHTPDALAKALTALREHCSGALWCVFGCGGDRDPGKRPIMGAIADELADEIIVTDDNPRSEDPQAITREIAAGIKQRSPRVIHDRAEAIGTALRGAAPADVVLIAGKGHEDYQIYGETRRSFSDRSEALRYLGAAA